MKTAIYIEGGSTQVVGSLGEAEIYRGSFYHCRGGWVRHRLGAPTTDDDSLIIRVNAAKVPEREFVKHLG